MTIKPLSKPMVFAAAALLLAGCASSQQPAETAPPPGACKAEAAQSLVGATASEAVGAQLLKLTGARVLRWGPPRTPMTMDYRYDRLTVSYDDDLKIQQIACN